MSEQNKALVRRWFDEVWNQGREDAVDELVSRYPEAAKYTSGAIL